MKKFTSAYLVTAFNRAFAVALFLFCSLLVTNVNAATGDNNKVYKALVPPPVTYFKANNTNICPGATVQFTDTSFNSPTGWFWSFPGGTPSTSTLQNPTVVYNTSGPYSVTLVATNAGGSDTLTKNGYIYVYTPPSAPTVTGNGPVCAGNTINLTVSGGFNTYSWTGPLGYTSTVQNPSISPATVGMAGSYTVVATNTASTCSNLPGTVNIVVNPSPTITVTPPTPSICLGNQANLTASGAVNYTWNPSSYLNTPSSSAVVASPTSNITYTINGIDGNGCAGSGNVTITVNPPPAVTANASPSTICQNASTTITATGAATYTWAPNGGLSATTGAVVTAMPATSITYTITGTSATGCVGTTTVSVTVNALPGSPIASSNSPVCVGNNINLTASGGSTTYSWTGPLGYTSSVQNPTISSASSGMAGTYSVVGTSGGTGCSSLPGTVNVVVNPSPTITATPSATSICYGSQANLSASGATNYTWAPTTGLSSPSSANTVATPLSTITYTVNGVNAGGCTGTTSVVVTVNPTPTLVISPGSTSICAGANTNLTASGASTYAWSPAISLNSTVTASVTASPTVSTMYSLTGTSATGCFSVDSVFITVKPTPTVTVNAGQSTICQGGSTTLTASGANSYTWAPLTSLTNITTSSATATPTSTTIYTITGTSANGCTNIATVSLALDTLFVSANAVNESCSGMANGNVTANVSFGTPPYNYSWNTGATANLISNVAAGTYSVTVTDNNGCTKSTVASVTQPTPIVDSISAQTNILCNGANTGSATIGVIGGTSPYTYSWAPSGITAPTASNLTAGTYTVTITDHNGCTKSSVVTITQPTSMVDSISAHTNISCNGAANGSASVGVLGGTAPYSYSWAPSGATTTTVNNLAAGTYTVTVTDHNGCASLAPTVTITQPAPLNIALKAVNESCNGLTNANISATVSGGTTPYTYNWSNGGTTNLIYNLTPGTYTVTVTDTKGCTSNSSASVTTPAALSVTASATNASCGLTNGTATATPAGGVIPYNYTWSTIPAQAGASVTGLAAGTYTVTLTDGTGCNATATTSVTSSGGPVITPTVTKSTCGLNDGRIKTNISGGTIPYRYSWNNGDTLSTDSNLAASTYILTVTDANGCSTFQAINVTDAGAPVITASGGSNVNCNGDTTGAISINVTGGAGGYKYMWSNAATTASITGLSAGPYQVTVTDASGCKVVSTINITEPGALAFNTNITPATCSVSDGAASIAVTGGVTPYVYAWSTGATSTGITGVAAGTYSVTVTDNNGCSITSLASVSNASGPLVTLDSVIDMNCSTKTKGQIIITASGGTPPYSYLWNNSATTQNVNNLAAGNYAVTVTDATGCKGTNSATITTALPPGLSICMVTVDPATGYNTIVWDKNNPNRIAKYILYRETTTPGIFNKIGSAVGDSGVYLDTLSNPGQRSWGYEISELDSCGQASPISQSVLFKTIHLTTTITPAKTVSLVWDNFQGASFNYYIIYRDSVAGIAKDSIASVSSNTFGYIDNPANNHNWYYHVGIGGGLTCNILTQRMIGHKVEAINYNASKSNTGNITLGTPTGIAAISSVNSLNIYPNPNRGVFNMSLNLDKQQNIEVRICNALGQVIEEHNYSNQNGILVKQYDFSAFSKGVYTVQVITSDGVTYRKVVIQ